MAWYKNLTLLNATKTDLQLNMVSLDLQNCSFLFFFYLFYFCQDISRSSSRWSDSCPVYSDVPGYVNGLR